MNKFCIYLSYAAVMCSSFASHGQDGFYLGAFGGYDSYKIKSSLNTLSNIPYNITPRHPHIGPAPQVPISLGQNITTGGGIAGGLLGYSKTFNKMPKVSLAGEFTANWVGAKSSTSNSLQFNIPVAASSTQEIGTYQENVALQNYYQIKDTFGLSIIPGYQFFDWMKGYIRLGYSWSNANLGESFQSRASFQNFIPVVTNLGSSALYFNRSTTLGGFTCGVGAEGIIYKNWSLRGEYTYIDFGSTNKSLTNTSLSDDRVTLGLIYRV